MKIFIIVIIILMLTLIASCSDGFTVTKMFTYPTKTKSYENNWDYIGEIRMVVHHSSFASICKKDIEIFVTNRQKDTLLLDTLSIIAGGIEPKIKWQIFNALQIIWVTSSDESDTTRALVSSFVFEKVKNRFVKQ